MDDMQTIPYAFVALFEDNNLPLPPVSKAIASTVEEVRHGIFANGSFSVDILPPNMSFHNLAFADEILAALPNGGGASATERNVRQHILDNLYTKKPSSEAEALSEDDVALFECGLSGHGVQNWYFRYRYISSFLRLGVLLPYGGAYGDSEEERKEIELALNIVQLCLSNGSKGVSFGGSDNLVLYLFITSSILSFKLKNEKGDILLESNSAEKLLDIIDINKENSEAVRHDNVAWLRI